MDNFLLYTVFVTAMLLFCAFSVGFYRLGVRDAFGVKPVFPKRKSEDFTEQIDREFEEIMSFDGHIPEEEENEKR